jgi:phage terminase large subunit-like protein
MVLDNGARWELEDFQAQIVADFFAGYDEAWAVVPEGNAKTTLMSGLALYWGHYTPSARIVLAAASRDQCQWLFDQAAGFVERSPGFAAHFDVQYGSRRIKCRRTSARIIVFAADDRTGDGAIFDLALLDELHRHRDMRLYRTWRGKVHKRGGMVGAISTAGEPGTEFEDARARMLAGGVDVAVDGFHTRAATADAVIHDWSVPRTADVNDIAVAKAANPLAAITVSDLEKKRQSPAMTETHWRRFVCNQAVRGEETAINPAEWGNLGTGRDIPAGSPVWLGVDFGWKHDTTAIVPLWLPEPERRVFGVPRILVPPRDGSFLEPAEVKAAFREFFDRFAVAGVVMDPDRGAEIYAWLRDDVGVEPAQHGQGVEMFDAYEKLMEAIRNGWIEHPSDETFTEHVLNAVAKTFPDGRARFERPSSSRAQAGQRRRVIDALIAAAMVHRSATADSGGEYFMSFTAEELANA